MQIQRKRIVEVIRLSLIVLFINHEGGNSLKIHPTSMWGI